jgi:hypothetical protein
MPFSVNPIHLLRCQIQTHDLALITTVGVFTVHAVWSKDHTHCIILLTNFEKYIAGFFIYSTCSYQAFTTSQTIPTKRSQLSAMLWDTMIFSCTVLGLHRAQLNILPSNNALLNTLRSQGVGYATVVWLTSVPASVGFWPPYWDLSRSYMSQIFLLLNLNC